MNTDSLNENGFKFSKKFGQNFIFDKNLLTAIIKDSLLTKEDEVLEIGPGAGTLTHIIADNCKRVVSYEIDTSLHPVLAQNLSDVKNSTIIFKDALKTDIKEIENNFEKGYKIVANLPYYITTPLIFKFLEQSKRVSNLTIMVQKEVGERFTASPGDKNYGAVTVMLNFYGEVKVLRQVPRRMFIPAPNVDSCIVQITIDRNKFDVDEKKLKDIVKFAFLNRRKTLINNLSALNYSKDSVAKVLETLGFAKDVRGEKLSIFDFVKISNLLK